MLVIHFHDAIPVPDQIVKTLYHVARSILFPVQCTTQQKMRIREYACIEHVGPFVTKKPLVLT